MPPKPSLPHVRTPFSCNMDRVNMSIAILPISRQYDWSAATVGLVQSSFFWGYLLTQVSALCSSEQVMRAPEALGIAGLTIVNSALPGNHCFASLLPEAGCTLP